jgi:hypothetical protein
MKGKPMGGVQSQNEGPSASSLSPLFVLPALPPPPWGFNLPEMQTFTKLI